MQSEPPTTPAPPQPEQGCPIPNTHRRLEEVHHLWHQSADAYADPESFRVNLNALIQAARNVTWILQKEKCEVPDFEPWYTVWQYRMGSDPVMPWLIKARNRVVKEGDLETRSVARISLTSTWEGKQEITTVEVPPLLPTDAIARGVRLSVPDEVRNTGVLLVERRWVVDDLPDRELLDALAHCYSILRTLVTEAHARCGVSFQIVELHDGSPRPVQVDHLEGRLPCMVANESLRSSVLNLRTGEFLRYREIEVPGDPEAGKRAAKRYGITDLVKDKTLSRSDPFAWAEFFLEMSKSVLRKDKRHLWMFWLFPMNASGSYLVFDPDDQQDKYQLLQQVADQVERTGATGLVIVGEVWMAMPEDLRVGQRPSEAANRREALMVDASTADGRTRSYITPFKRVSGRIRFEPTEVLDGQDILYLEPVRRVWQRRATTSSEGKG